MIRRLLPGAVVTLLLFGIRFGYDWGASDQDEFLPYLTHLLDPALFTTDWFVQGQVTSFSIRSSFVHVLKAMALTGLGPLGAVHVVYVLSFLGLALSIGVITWTMTNARWASVLSMPMALVFTARWSPGGNDAVYGMLVPEMPAWALVFVAVALVMHRRPALMAGFLLGTAVFLHPLAGLQAGALLIVWLWWVRRDDRQHTYVLMMVWLLVAIPVVWAVMSAGTSQSYESRVILTTLRAPHHYLPEAFSLGATVRFLSLTGLAGLMLWLRPRAFINERVRRDMAWLLGIALGVHAVSWMLVAAAPDSFIVALQPFKLTVFTRILSACVVTTGVVHLLATSSLGVSTNRFVSRIPGRATEWAIVALIPVLMVLIMMVPAVQHRTLPALTPERQAFNARAERVRQSVSPTDVVTIPPDWTGFQFASKRAQFVTFKAYPFVDTAAQEWKRRLEQVGAVSRAGRTGTTWLAASATAYRERSDPEWRTLLPTLQATHVLLPARTGIEPKLFCDAEWCLVDARGILPQ